MAESLTIYDSFSEGLPRLEDRYTENQRTISGGAPSTLAQDPLRVWEAEDPSPLLAQALDRLDERDPILQAYMPQVEQSHLLRHEADIVRASNLQLLHPVNQAIERCVLNNHRLYCVSEVVAPNSRTDVRWHCEKPNGSMVTIAILEFKNTKVIDWSEFNVIRARNPADARRIIDQGSLDETLSKLKGNAFWLTKQVLKYHRPNDNDSLIVNDIAIFDWYKMMIFDFSEMNEDKDTPISAKAIAFEEFKRINFDISADVRRYYTFRTMLYAFLLRALNRHGLLRRRRRR